MATLIGVGSGGYGFLSLTHDGPSERGTGDPALGPSAPYLLALL